ncbi:Gamma-tubulin complex component 3 [Chionoecetes opilio]|uniref:Gamma-tubulin complex component 3 n=1 Tax=Chionoecetes opilio TaxID=41210 RepID=A0A8J5CQU8_CHIOP|nr:Gamma-tubulin complex component 3 [Chionoecetes opilio]
MQNKKQQRCPHLIIHCHQLQVNRMCCHQHQHFLHELKPLFLLLRVLLWSVMKMMILTAHLLFNFFSRDMVQSFLLMLAQHDDQNLHLLSTRLDFNEYYHRRDHRLNQRLTYHHKRKSMGTSFCQ